MILAYILNSILFLFCAATLLIAALLPYAILAVVFLGFFSYLFVS